MSIKKLKEKFENFKYNKLDKAIEKKKNLIEIFH